MRRGKRNPDERWRITPAGAALLGAMLFCFVVATITGAVFFFAVGCILLLIVGGGFFTSLPNNWRSGGDDSCGTGAVDPTGKLVTPPDDE